MIELNPQQEPDKYCSEDNHLWIESTPVEEGEKSIIICLNCKITMKEFRENKK